MTRSALMTMTRMRVRVRRSVIPTQNQKLKKRRTTRRGMLMTSQRCRRIPRRATTITTPRNISMVETTMV